jgi:hypothetical protein
MASALHFGGDVMVSEEYKRGFMDAIRMVMEFRATQGDMPRWMIDEGKVYLAERKEKRKYPQHDASGKRKLTKWQKFVKQKSKLPRFKYKTGKRKGMVNMKAVAAAWKKVPKSKK